MASLRGDVLRDLVAGGASWFVVAGRVDAGAATAVARVAVSEDMATLDFAVLVIGRQYPDWVDTVALATPDGALVCDASGAETSYGADGQLLASVPPAGAVRAVLRFVATGTDAPAAGGEVAPPTAQHLAALAVRAPDAAALLEVLTANGNRNVVRQLWGAHLDREVLGSAFTGG